MKKKYFIIGFATGALSIVILVITVFIIFIRQSQNSTNDLISNQKIVGDEIEVFPVTQGELDSLFFNKVNEDLHYFVNKDSSYYTFVNYWATWCIPCVSELPEFVELMKKELSGKITFIFATQESEKKVNKFIDKKKITLPYFTYNKKDHPTFINHSTIPTSYLIDENNMLVYRFNGTKRWNSDFYYKIISNIVLSPNESH